jgi:hypothetical protein
MMVPPHVAPSSNECSTRLQERVSSVLDAWPDEGRSSGGLPPPSPVDPALWQHPDPCHYRPCFARDQETRLPGTPVSDDRSLD